MGWTSKSYKGEGGHIDWPLKDLGDFLNEEIQSNGYYIKKAYLHKAQNEHDHNEIYLVMEHPKGYNFLMVTLVDINNGEIYWKDIDESMGPAYYNCPIAYLDLFPAKGEYAKKWREECRKRNITNVA